MILKSKSTSEKQKKVLFKNWYQSVLRQISKKKDLKDKRFFCPFKQRRINPDSLFTMVLSVYKEGEIYDRHLMGTLEILYDKYDDYIMSHYDEDTVYIKSYHAARKVRNLNNLMDLKKVRGYMNPLVKIKSQQTSKFIVFENDGMCMYRCIQKYIEITDNQSLQKILDNSLCNISYIDLINKIKKKCVDVNLAVVNHKIRSIKTNNNGYLKHKIIKIELCCDDNVTILIFDFKQIMHACLYLDNIKNISDNDLIEMGKSIGDLKVSNIISSSYDSNCSSRKNEKKKNMNDE